MKNRYKSLLIVSSLVIMIFSVQKTHAGNKDRSGQAAAQHLLINPWAASNGWGSVGVSSVKGIESVFGNVAGLAFTRKTEIAYTNTLYCFASQNGSGTNINSIGVAQSLGENRGNLAITAMIMTFGDIDITTTEQPEGGLGTFSPMMMNLSLSYAKSFSDAIHAGATVRLINETTSDISAIGFVIDAGIQYVTGKYDQFQIGVALKNIGLPMNYKGNGLDFRGYAEGSTKLQTFSNRSQSYEMPLQFALGLSYDFLFGDKNQKQGSSSITSSGTGLSRATARHRLTLAGSFLSNAYSKDQFIVGLEYSLMDYFQLRAAYTFEEGMWKDATNTSIYLGPSCGTSVLIPLGKKVNSRLAIDYAYRFTVKWQGCHSIGARIIL